MKKRKRQAEIHIETVYNPYSQSAHDSYVEIYQRYLEDDSRMVEIDGLIYYRAAQISKLTIRNESALLVFLPWKITPEKNCVIVDENGNQYEYRGCEMYRFSGEIPEWYSKMVVAILSFPDGEIGEYFAKQNISKA